MGLKLVIRYTNTKNVDIEVGSKKGDPTSGYLG